MSRNPALVIQCNDEGKASWFKLRVQDNSQQCPHGALLKAKHCHDRGVAKAFG
jgi:hypothetical protein